jgi:dimethylargininase
LTRVVVCSPKTEYFSVDDPAAHNIPELADEGVAVKQHGALRCVLEDYGAEVIDVEELVGHPNSVFVRDAAVTTPRGYVAVRMGIDTRLGEERWMADKLDAIGEPCAGEIQRPGTVEGGDVVVAGHVVFAGITRRTNAEGVEQLSRVLRDMDIEVRSVSLPDLYLHLDQTIGVVGSRRLMCCRGLFPEGFFEGFELIESPCHESNVNFICLGEDEIIAPLANREVVKIARDSGVRVHEVDVSEFAKGAGGPNCLVMPLERT